MSLLDWSKVQQRAALMDKESSGSIPRPNHASRPVQRRKSVQGTPSSLVSSSVVPRSRHSLQAYGFLSRPLETPPFQHPHPPRPDYDIVWNSSTLGIAFRCNSKNLAVIRRIESDAPPQVLQQAHVGDVLLATNGEPNINFDACMDRLRTLDHPVVLTFGPSPRSPVAPAAQSLSLDDRSSFYTSSENAITQTTPGRVRRSGAPSLVSTDMNESIVSRDVDDPENLHHITYTIEWLEGLKLGVSIIKMGNIPVVKERTVPASLAPPSLSQIQAHDQLIAIQGHSTADLGYKASIVLLRDAKKPVQLEFRRKVQPVLPPSPSLAPTACSRESDYSLVWEDGPLGLTLKKDKVHHTMVVARLNGDGLAARCNLISLGDRLVSVSNVKVQELGLRGTMEFLKAVPKPATLVFHRRVSDPEVEPRLRDSLVQTSSSVSNTDEELQASKQGDEPAIVPPTVDAKAAQSDAPEHDDVVTPLVTLQSSPSSSTPPSKDPPLPLSHTSTSTNSDLDDSGLLTSRLYAAPPSNVSACGLPMIEIVWASGPLGMTLKQSGKSVVVSRITGKGEAPNLRDLQMGDILVAVNEMDTTALDLTVVTTLLKSLVKPARLQFVLQKTEEDL
ncbi:hypothetical protein H310_09149 [Aphanomyces invadans]|uniref:PDZ domain-containing protein n=1 Tax=Aphanomyces invadans TaxID=157072 RepID=A0A024TUT6_9STRA|nr:hypothetical protein H310_09149 [Aphanomyces invadans]ETV97798.1 hypothetical protein H310_09149 [Aphanomyces invadans]|eukprot:XP_008873359.1 hypothetical protein H310_09149 [Aphanomyces invadans]